MIPVVRAYGFLSFNHFEDIEVAINMDKKIAGVRIPYVINKYECICGQSIGSA